MQRETMLSNLTFAWSCDRRGFGGWRRAAKPCLARASAWRLRRLRCGLRDVRRR